MVLAQKCAAQVRLVQHVKVAMRQMRMMTFLVRPKVLTSGLCKR